MVFIIIAILRFSMSIRYFCSRSIITTIKGIVLIVVYGIVNNLISTGFILKASITALRARPNNDYSSFKSLFTCSSATSLILRYFSLPFLNMETNCCSWRRSPRRNKKMMEEEEGEGEERY
jgi:hypothetical protein